MLMQNAYTPGPAGPEPMMATLLLVLGRGSPRLWGLVSETLGAGLRDSGGWSLRLLRSV